eukprot:747968-Hanusia_phi.AAC.1
MPWPQLSPGEKRKYGTVKYGNTSQTEPGTFSQETSPLLRVKTLIPNRGTNDGLNPENRTVRQRKTISHAHTHTKQRKAWGATGAKHRTTHRAWQPAAQTALVAPSPVTRARTSEGAQSEARPVRLLRALELESHSGAKPLRGSDFSCG